MIDGDELEANLQPWGAPPPGSESRSANRPRLSAVADVDAAQTATLNLGRPPAGLHWLVERGSFVVAGLAGDVIQWLVFVGAVQDDMIEDFAEITVAVAGTVRAVGEWAPSIYVPSNTPLIMTVADADPAGQARVTVRVVELPN